MTSPTQKTHYDIPQKSCVQGAHKYMLTRRISYDPRNVFEYFSMKERTGYNIIQSGASFRTHHNSEFEAHGRKYKITSKQVREADHLLQDDNLGLEAKALPWEAVTAEVEIEVTRQTICKTMNVALGYGKCLAYVKGHQSEHAKAKRMEWALFMLAKYPLKEDWQHIRFSNEIHFGYGPEDQL